MRGAFKPDTKLMRGAFALGRLMLLNLLFLFCSLGVVTAGASTAALYRCVIDEVRGKETGAGDFFRAFRRNFVPSTAVWLLELIVLVSLYLNISIAISADTPAQMTRLLAFCVIPVLLIQFISSWIYPLIAQFDNKLRRYFELAFIMSFRHFFQVTLPLLAYHLLPVVFFLYLGLEVSVFYFGFVWLLIAFSGVAYLDARRLVPVLNRYAGIKDEEELNNKGEQGGK